MVAWAPYHLDVYARRPAEAWSLYKIDWNSFWNPPWIEQTSGPVCDLVGDPAVASWGWAAPTSSRGMDGNLWHYAWTGSAGWVIGGSTEEHAAVLEGGPATSSPVAISWKKGRIDVFALGEGAALGGSTRST